MPERLLIVQRLSLGLLTLALFSLILSVTNGEWANIAALILAAGLAGMVVQATGRWRRTAIGVNVLAGMLMAFGLVMFAKEGGTITAELIFGLPLALLIVVLSIANAWTIIKLPRVNEAASQLQNDDK